MMPSKLKQRRNRRLKTELRDLNTRVIGLADEIALLHSQILRVPMPVIVPAEIIHQLDRKICRTCNDGLRDGCSSCAYRFK